MNRIGILAYGSLIADPGRELREATKARIKDVPTPFKVEFARSSRGRDGAPTIVPVESGGCQVNGVILVLKDAVSAADARSILWRRETNQIDSPNRYQPQDPVTRNTVIVAEYVNIGGVGLVLSTRIGANIFPLTARRLAELAVSSARAKAGPVRRDGISYLIDAKADGILTPLMDPYERYVLDLTGARNLSEAWSCEVEKATPLPP